MTRSTLDENAITPKSLIDALNKAQEIYDEALGFHLAQGASYEDANEIASIIQIDKFTELLQELEGKKE